ncbi:MAG: glycosyl transferase family 1, partial [Actinomycetota bacterium]
MTKEVGAYEEPAGREAVEALRALAEPFRGARVLHVNATAFGGGVAELLGTVVPLMRDLGLDAEWHVLHGSDEFFAV